MISRATATKQMTVPKAAARATYSNGKRPRSIHESTARRVARGLGLIASRPSPQAGFSVLDPRKNNTVIAGPGLSPLQVWDFCKELEDKLGGTQLAPV